MIRVDQTQFGFPGGNCFSACVASLLELRLEDVPYFMGRDDWFQGFADWLARWNLFPLSFPIAGARGARAGWPPGLYIAGGPSPRDPAFMHAVIARGEEVVHDPHPSRGGLVAFHDATLLVSLDLGEHHAIQRVARVLEREGCSCECGHHGEEHERDCERCLGCRVEDALEALPW